MPASRSGSTPAFIQLSSSALLKEVAPAASPKVTVGDAHVDIRFRSAIVGLKVKLLQRARPDENTVPADGHAIAG